MTPYLIIDGYNLMHAAGIARRRYASGDLERCRSRLHRELAMRLAANVLSTAVVVYDAFDSPGNDDRQQQHAGVNVLFAAQGHDADSLIEQLLQQHSVPKRVIVVSSDHRLHKAARRRKAKCVDSEDFWFGLEPDTDAAHPAPSIPRPAADVPTVDIATKLQQWAEHASQAENDAPVDSGIREAFDDEYLKRLIDDIDKGRLK